VANDGTTPTPRPRRALTPLDWIVRVPIGFLWLGILMIAAVPIFVYMTVLYWCVQGASSLPGKRNGRSAPRNPREERVA
jgi:hypothetical protein